MALYRKYRPQVFADVVGQDHIIKTLQRAIASNRLGHAYLFCGARGVGKTSVARILAKAVNCLDEKNRPCGKCKICQDIAKGQFIDLIEIDAASNRGIDEIRELRDKIRFAPNIGKKKVYIIDEIHMLTREAFNALLKTLEEPPEHSIFIFATTEVGKLPETIISRCQRFDFRLGGADTVEKVVADIARSEKLKISEDIVKLIARASGGSYRDAQSLLDQIAPHLTEKELVLDEALKILNLSALDQILEFIDVLHAGVAATAIQYLDTLSDRGVSFEQFVNGLVNQLRTQLVSKIQAGEDSRWEERSLKRLLEAVGQMKLSPIESLPLELAAIDLCDEPSSEDKNRVAGNIQSAEDKDRATDESYLPADKIKGADIKPHAANKPPTKPDDRKVLASLSAEQKIAFVESISAKNKPLGSLVGSSQLHYDDGILRILVEYPLYKTKVMHKNSLALLESELSAILGQTAKIECELSREDDIGGEIGEVFGV